MEQAGKICMRISDSHSIKTAWNYKQKGIMHSCKSMEKVAEANRWNHKRTVMVLVLVVRDN
jgi:hypothetical protein